MRILLTNDDGIEAQGLLIARKILAKSAEVWVVAPAKDQSGVSHSLTLREPIRVDELGSRIFKVFGTPTDCVLLAYHQFIRDGIDLIIAGINHGYNMGYDVFYSGTVGAALQGGILGIKSMSISISDIKTLGGITRFLPDLVAKTIELVDKKIVLNINSPENPKGFRITKLGKRIYHDEVVTKSENKHIGYYVIDGTLSHELSAQTDFEAIEDGYISITPLNLDLTDHEIYQKIKKTFTR